MKSITYTIKGIRPLVMHNGLLADPMNPYTKEIKKITSKGTKKITDEMHALKARLEWEGSLYWDDASGGVVIPSDNIDRLLQLGAQKNRKGKDVQAAVFCTDDYIPVQYEGPKGDKEKLFADPSFHLRKGVVLPGGRVIRVRPMIPTGWRLKFNLEYDDSVVSKKDIDTALKEAGSLIGLGDHRPKFGRFIVIDGLDK